MSDETRALYARNVKLRECLLGTRAVLVNLRAMSKTELHRGFDMWIAKIDEALNGED